YGPEPGPSNAEQGSYASAVPGIWGFVSPMPFPQPGSWHGRTSKGAAAMPQRDAAGCCMTDSDGGLRPSDIVLRPMSICCQSIYVHTLRCKTSGADRLVTT